MPGMHFISLMVFGTFAIVFFVAAATAFAVLRKIFPNRRSGIAIVSASIGATMVVGLIVWLTYCSSPLKLPRGAAEVKIERASPFSSGMDDNLRFRVSQAEFRSWVEGLCGQSWQSIQASARETIFEAFEDGRSASAASKTFGTARWMDTSRVKKGYIIHNRRAFPGRILYDTDSELAYYSYWD